ncbi:MAG TPA: hypothetical protein VKG24_21430 [Pseudolabrys sp.]|nr:hypothetical protein [Pseudolabrys sp.]
MKLWHGRRTHRPFVHRGVVLAPAQNDAADFVVSDGPDDPLAILRIYRSWGTCMGHRGVPDMHSSVRLLALGALAFLLRKQVKDLNC